MPCCIIAFMLSSAAAYMYCILLFVLLSPFYKYIYIVGGDWVSRIGSAIQGCKGLVAVITNNYVNSDSCTKELHHGP